MQEWEWENTTALARREAELRGIDTFRDMPRHAPLDERAQHEFSRLMLGLPEIVRIEVWDRDSTVVWSDEPRLIGQRFPDDNELRRIIFITGDTLNPVTKQFLDRTGAGA